MSDTSQAAYYAAREQAARRLAEAATDPAVRRIHHFMAASYRQRHQYYSSDALAPQCHG
jgi:isopropylmalate/homocitrate/citramalate synthase